MDKPQTWLISLHDYYAQGILDGTYPYEYKRVKMSVKVGDRVLLYVTGKTRRVIGEFIVGENSLFGVSEEEMLQTAPHGQRPSLASWAYGAKSFTALEVTHKKRYPAPRKLDDMTNLTQGPRSYCRVEVVNE